MKKLLPLLLLVLFVSCATSPETVAYRTIATTAVSVDSAMRGWGDWVKSGKASVSSEDSVRTVYESYQVAMTAMQTSINAFRLGANRNIINKASASLSASADAVIEIIRKNTNDTN